MLKDYLALFQYYGAKTYLIKDILAIVGPIHDKIQCYVDVFGGSGRVLLNIPLEWGGVRVYNDLDKRLYRLMKALQDERQRAEIIERLELSLHSRALFEEYRAKNEDEITPFEYLYVIINSFHGLGRSFAIRVQGGPRSHIDQTIQNIKRAAKYLRLWVIENLDFRDLIKKYDRPTTFFYLDPPYLSNGRYKYRFTMQDLQDLHSLCANMKGFYLLNESEVDFDAVSGVFGPPQLVKETTSYTAYSVTEKSRLNVKYKTGFWFNFGSRWSS